MILIEKLETIASNEKKVYDAGKARGYIDGEAAGYIEGYNRGAAAGAGKDYNDGYSDGKQAEYDAFWDGFTNHGQRTDYRYAFLEWSGAEYIRPNRKIIPTALTSANQLFSRCYKLKKVEAQYFDFSQKPMGTQFGEGFYYTFSQCQSLEEVEDIGMQADINNTYLFSGCRKLHTVAMLRANESTTYNSSFANCDELRNIRFDGVIGQDVDFKWSKKLSTESIRSIISHLSDMASGKTLTLSKTAVDNASLIDGVQITPKALIGGATFHSNVIPLNAGERLKVELLVDDDHFYHTATYDEEKYEDEYVDPAYWCVALCTPGYPGDYIEEEKSYVYVPDRDVELDVKAFIRRFTTDATSPSAIFSIRAVKVDENGNEITGENLYSALEINGIQNVEGWDMLVASKPNWTISLV